MISYAQNFEDVMLWRALKHVPQGCYIDIGAWDPVDDSVSLAFYERGWRGVHVEPVEIFAKKIREARPDELVINAAVGIENNSEDLFVFEGTGLSTLSPEIADKHTKSGFLAKCIKVQLRTLDSIFSEVGGREIHWLKIDVEGMEESVIQSWYKNPARPWIVVVESTIPGSSIETSAGKEALIKLGYKMAYFDGLNRFYVHEIHPELTASFRLGPNIFDGFIHANSRNHQQTAQYQDLRNIVAEGRASEGALKAEILALGQHYKELGAGMETARQESAKTREATQALDQKLQESLNQGLKSGQNLKNELKAQQEAVATSIGSLKEELAQQQKSQQEANLLDQVLLKGFMVELKETREKEVERGQELRQELEAQKVATSKGVKELGDSLVGLKQELEAQKVATSKGVEELGDSIVGLKEELIHELRGLVGGLNERQDQLQQRNLAEMDALRSSLEDRLGKNESHLMDLANYAEQIQDSVVAPSSYLIPAPFSWYSCLYKMLKIKKPVILNKNKTSGEAPKRPGFWRRLEQSIRKRRKRLFGRIGFDRKWYLQEYPEVGPSGIDPLDHYLRFGVEEQRWKSRRHKEKGLASVALRKKRPGFFRRLEISIRKRRKRLFGGIGFDREWYLQEYPEVRLSGIEPLDHYVFIGKKEGRWRSHKQKAKYDEAYRSKLMLKLSPTSEKYFTRLKQLTHKKHN